ncbi:hypothetical protein [Cedecea sp. P7760]|uniref:hypothetical protein n=1 Tax=Cedecea sp. P7760 TaxID=2726983 RepID=UPI0015A1D17C|nr:hypothetical protein [Cedecea sp. P7760]NWC65073.1 hypothetical protein [Cedecea sp. P7760]
MKNAIKFLSLVTMILGADLAFADEYIDKVKSQVYSEFRDERPLSVVMSSRQDCEKGEWKSFDWDGIQKGVNYTCTVSKSNIEKIKERYNRNAKASLDKTLSTYKKGDDGSPKFAEWYQRTSESIIKSHLTRNQMLRLDGITLSNNWAIEFDGTVKYSGVNITYAGGTSVSKKHKYIKDFSLLGWAYGKPTQTPKVYLEALGPDFYKEDK